MRTALPVASVLALLALIGCEQRSAQQPPAPAGAQQTPAPAPTPAPTPAPDPAPAPAPSSTPPAAAQPAPGAASAASEFPWRAPEGWVLDPAPRQMRVATYRVPDPQGGSEAEVAITRFPADVGGELANVNRWRGQMGLAPVDQAGLEGVLQREEVGTWKLYHTRSDGTGAAAGKAMLASAAFDPASNQTWFVRTTVSTEQAERLSPAVQEFARSIARGDSR